MKYIKASSDRELYLFEFKQVLELFENVYGPLTARKMFKGTEYRCRYTLYDADNNKICTYLKIRKRTSHIPVYYLGPEFRYLTDGFMIRVVKEANCSQYHHLLGRKNNAIS